MRVLHVTDTHLGARWTLSGAPPTLRADDHRRALELALAPALRGEVGLVVHSGDLFDHRHPDRVAVAAARELLGAAGRKVDVVVLSGNHDRDALRAALADLPGVVTADRPHRFDAGGVRFGLVPWERTAEGFAARCAGWDVDVLVAHQAFDGHRVPGFTFRSDRRPDTVGAAHLPSARFVMCGHLHPRQVVRVGAATVVCPGSTERTAFSEAAQTKGYALWTADGHRFVDLPARPLVRVERAEDLDRVTPGCVAHAIARWEGPIRERGGYVHLERTQLSLFAAAR